MARIKYRRYTNKDRPAEMDPIVDPPRALTAYVVECRRRLSTAGGLTAFEVKATSPDEAARMVREGEVPGIGLGWRPVRVREA